MLLLFAPLIVFFHYRRYLHSQLYHTNTLLEFTAGSHTDGGKVKDAALHPNVSIF